MNFGLTAAHAQKRFRSTNLPTSRGRFLNNLSLDTRRYLHVIEVDSPELEAELLKAIDGPYLPYSAEEARIRRGSFCTAERMFINGRVTPKSRWPTMFWTETGAQNILNLRGALFSHRWEECWKQISNPNDLEIKAAA